MPVIGFFSPLLLKEHFLLVTFSFLFFFLSFILNTDRHSLASLTFVLQTLSHPQRANHYWLIPGIIEGPGGLFVPLVNGDPATLLSKSTITRPLSYLSISPLLLAHALGWFSGIDSFHLSTSSEKKIYWCNCPTLNTSLNQNKAWGVYIKKNQFVSALDQL